MMLINSSERENPCFVSNLKRKASSFSPLSMMLFVGFCRWFFFNQIEGISLYSFFVESFYHECALDLCQMLSLQLLIWMWFFFFFFFLLLSLDVMDSIEFSNAELAFLGYIWLGCSVQFSSVTQSCPTLCNPMDCNTPVFPGHHQLPKLVQTYVHQVVDAIQPSLPLSSPSPSAFNLS